MLLAASPRQATRYSSASLAGAVIHRPLQPRFLVIWARSLSAEESQDSILTNAAGQCPYIICFDFSGSSQFNPVRSPAWWKISWGLIYCEHLAIFLKKNKVFELNQHKVGSCSSHRVASCRNERVPRRQRSSAKIYMDSILFVHCCLYIKSNPAFRRPTYSYYFYIYIILCLT